MDMNRLYRAKIAVHMQAVDAQRRRFLEGKLKPTEIGEDDWNLILEMDRIAGEDD